MSKNTRNKFKLIMKELKTLSGLPVPPIGLGTFPLQGREMADTVLAAAQIGYRLIDTSDDYRGETGIGIACSELYQKTGLKREDLFFQTKISQDNSYWDDPLDGVWFNPNSIHQKLHTVRDVVREKVSISLREMKTQYIDSVLIHYPFPGYYYEIWEELISLKNEGIIRYIGVSNFFQKHIEVIKKSGEIPAINEVFFSPLCTRENLLSFLNNNNIMPLCYSPLLGVKGKIAEEALSQIMNKYNKSLSQIILRWHVDRGCIPIPKSKNKNRLKVNFSILDFSLTQEEVQYINSFNQDFVVAAESLYCPGI